MRALFVLLLSSCNIPSPAPPDLRPVEDHFLVYEPGHAEDVATAPNGDLVVVGCEPAGATVVRRIDPRTHKVAWTRRSASPCGGGDNWTVPRVAVTDAGTIWVAAYGWGRGPHAEPAPTSVLAFDATGTLGAQRELPAGVRVRAMLGLAGERVAIAGQSATIHDRSSAFIAVLGADAAELWRRALTGPHQMFVESLARDGERVVIGGYVDSTIEVIDGVGRGRESDAFVHVLSPDGKIAATVTRHHAGINIYDVRVAVIDGHAFVAMKLGQRVGNPWPRTLPALPAGAFGAVLVEPLVEKPAWRKVFAGSTHASVAGFAAAGDRLALVLDFQAGEIDVGRGSWRSTFFNLGAYVELAAATGDVTDARKLETTGADNKVFFRRVIWDGETFTAVGQVEGTLLAPRTLQLAGEVPFVWRVGIIKST